MEISLLVQCLLVDSLIHSCIHSFGAPFISILEICCDFHICAAAESFQCCARADGKSHAGQRALWALYKYQSRRTEDIILCISSSREDQPSALQKWKWSWHVWLSPLQSSSHASASSRPQPFPSHRWALRWDTLVFH